MKTIANIARRFRSGTSFFPSVSSAGRAACLLLLLALSPIPPPLEAEEDLDGILVKLNNYRGLDVDNMKVLLEMRTDEGLFRKIEVFTNRTQSMVKFLQPAKVKGQAILNADAKNLWFYVPGNKRLVKISPTQRLIGRVSVGDVLSLDLRIHYRISAVAPEPDGKSLLLTLEGKTKNALYAKIQFWVDGETYRPIKSGHFSISGKLMKTVLYQKYRDFNGTSLIGQAVVVDEVGGGEDTVVDYVSYDPVKLPGRFFNKANLENI